MSRSDTIAGPSAISQKLKEPRYGSTYRNIDIQEEELQGFIYKDSSGIPSSCWHCATGYLSFHLIRHGKATPAVTNSSSSSPKISQDLVLTEQLERLITE